MILEEETFKKFGYYPKDLNPKSTKRILAKCDKCSKIRILYMYHYRDLCRSCARVGFHHSEETKRKIGENSKNSSDETKRKRKESRKQFYKTHDSPLKGKSLSVEHKQNMSAGLKGRQVSDETRQKIRNSLLGKHHSKEVKRKIANSLKGEKSPNWKGGISFEPYCILFNESFKERVREFWNRKCVVCGKDEIENGRRLDIHHVRYNKNTCCDDTIPLFIPLCRSCHMKTNFDREYWQKEFKRIIYNRNIDGKCFYIEKEMEKIDE